MDAWLSNTEITLVVKDKLGVNKRERIVLNPNRSIKIRELALSLLSLIF